MEADQTGNKGRQPPTASPAQPMIMPRLDRGLDETVLSLSTGKNRLGGSVTGTRARHYKPSKNRAACAAGRAIRRRR